MTVVAIPRGVRPAALSGGAAYSSHPVGAFLVFCARFLWLPIPSSAFYSGFLRLNQEKVFSESTFGSGWDCQGEKRRWQEVDVGKSSGGVPWDEVHRDDVNCTLGRRELGSPTDGPRCPAAGEDAHVVRVGAG